MHSEPESRGAVEERSHALLQPPVTPPPRATFPSYDLYFPALPVKKVGRAAEEGPTIQGWLS